MIRAILFDLDGVLINAGKRHFNTPGFYQQAFQELGCEQDDAAHFLAHTEACLAA